MLESDFELSEEALLELIQRKRQLEQGLSNEQIEGLDLTRVTSEVQHSLIEECCSICLETFGQDECVRKIKCKHVFHQKCIDQWLVRKGECPNCKASLRN